MPIPPLTTAKVKPSFKKVRQILPFSDSLQISLLNSPTAVASSKGVLMVDCEGAEAHRRGDHRFCGIWAFGPFGNSH
jgi:hypothetical protein